MRIGRLTAYLLTAALLVQAAYAQAAMPCMSGQSHGAHPQALTATAQSSGSHDHQAMQHPGHSDGQQLVQSAGEMPCCDDMSDASCISGNCLSAGNLLTSPEPGLRPVMLQACTAHLPNWLPAYGAPATLIYRPPIA